MKKKGRPLKIDKLILQKLEEVFSLGGSDEEACLYADIGKSTLYDYQTENPEFSERKHILKQKPILLARQEIIKGLKGNPELALKYLERKKRNEFSLKYTAAIPENKPTRSYEQLLREMREEDELEKARKSTINPKLGL